MVWGFLDANPILNALPHWGALTSFQYECILIDQMIYSLSMPLCLNFSPLKCSYLNFLELNSPK